MPRFAGFRWCRAAVHNGPAPSAAPRRRGLRPTGHPPGRRCAGARARRRDLFSNLEQEYPHLKENMLSAMGNLDPGRLLDTRFHNPDDEPKAELFPIVTEL